MQTICSFVKRIWKILLACIVLCAGIFLFFRYGYQPVEGFQKTIFEMGTAVSMTVYDNNNKALFDIEEMLHTLNEEVLSWRGKDSEIAKINENGQGILSDTLEAAFTQSMQIAEDTKGAFDISLRNLIELWGIETDAPKVPVEDELKMTLSTVGYGKIVINSNSITLNDDVQLDMGAMGKGYALDIVRKYLDNTDISGAVISVGGSILTYKAHEGKSWRIGIQKPDGEPGEYQLALLIQGTACISTSGDYEKYFEENGIRYHHIFDQSTGKPAMGDVSSVTVICENGLVSDALSTACLVMGYENSLDVLKKYQAEAIFIMKDGSLLTTEDFSIPYEVIE